jgi:hypothetical protein
MIMIKGLAAPLRFRADNYVELNRATNGCIVYVKIRNIAHFLAKPSARDFTTIENNQDFSEETQEDDFDDEDLELEIQEIYDALEKENDAESNIVSDPKESNSDKNEV